MLKLLRAHQSYLARVLVVFASFGGSVACGSSEGTTRPPAAGDFTGMGGESPIDRDPCLKPNTPGCPCETPGESVDCGTIYRDTDGYLSCTFGLTLCSEDGTWGECIGDTISLLPVPTTGAR